MTTKELEQSIYFSLEKLGTYLCFEVMIPYEKNRKNTRERVDLLTLDTKGIWRFYELKVSKADFYSKAAHTFLGNYNYYVVPKELYPQIEKDIPKHIGCYVVDDTCAWCEKKPQRQDLKVNNEKLLFAFMQSLSRENEKYRRLLRQI